MRHSVPLCGFQLSEQKKKEHHASFLLIYAIVKIGAYSTHIGIEIEKVYNRSEIGRRFVCSGTYVTGRWVRYPLSTNPPPLSFSLSLFGNVGKTYNTIQAMQKWAHGGYRFDSSHSSKSNKKLIESVTPPDFTNEISKYQFHVTLFSLSLFLLFSLGLPVSPRARDPIVIHIFPYLPITPVVIPPIGPDKFS